VDGTGSIPGSFPSLTLLKQGATINPGDTIRIKGLQDPSGTPVAYSNVAGFPGQSTENFTLLVFPHGVTIQPHDSVPVYIAAAGGLNPPFLLRIEGASTNPSVQTLIGRLTLIGGTVGIDLDQSGVSGEKQVQIREVTFCRSKIGLSAVADNATIAPRVVDCTVTDQHPALVQLPTYQGVSFGFRFHGVGLHGVGKVVASVENLTLSGTFPSIAPEPFSNPDTDLSVFTTTATRLIDLFTSGAAGEGEHSDLDPFGALLPIPQVVLTVTGGLWSGFGKPDGGWGIAICAATVGNFRFSPDYLNGYKITVTGTTMSDFYLAGVHAMTGENTRGEIYLNGQTTIQGTGPGTVPPPYGYVHSGAHLYTFRGHLALVATDANFYDNDAHGIWLHNRGSLQADTDFPNGLFLAATRCKAHLNGLDGIAMEAGTPTEDNPFRGEAIVGGTWDTWGGYRSLVHQGTEPAANELPQGVGFINRCAISNNGRYGVSAKVFGRREDDQDPSDVFSVASCRIANSIIWNNPGGGVSAALQEYTTGVGSPTLLMPVVHSTVVGNGDATGFNVEVTDSSSGASAGKFEYASGTVPGSPSEVLVCRLFNSLFQRKSATAEDFGQQLRARIAIDHQFPVQVSDTSLGVEACRFSPAFPFFNFQEYTDIDVFPLFAGTLNWTSLFASQFFLSSTGANNEIGECVNWNLAAPDESAKDFTDYTRTGILVQRDFGAYQKDPRP